MTTFLVAAGSFIGFIVAYQTYGRWLGRKIFRLDDRAITPAAEVNDGIDYVPTNRHIVFGHHFTSIAGTGPIVGPAIAVFWGWLPALLWVLFGSIFIGAVHDFGSLVVSLRSRGQTIGDAAARMINPRARILFLVILFLALAVVIGVFGLVIATIFATYPGSVLAIWIEIPIAVIIGFYVYRRGGGIMIPSIIALILMYVGVWLGSYFLPIDLTKLDFITIHATGSAAESAGASPFANAIVVWTVLLLIYCFIASVLPVWMLLQPRDFINSHQLIVVLALIMLGMFLTPMIGGGLDFVAPAINSTPPSNAPPIWPFLFITIACGAVSGFHCLVSSGTSSKQIRKETDARMVGYGAMLLEGALAVIVIIACTAGLGGGIYDFHADSNRYVQTLHADGSAVVGKEAWDRYYGSNDWSKMRLKEMIGGFIEGGANLLRTIRIPPTLGIGIMAVLVASFAATTLDTSTRLQRYVISELAAAIQLPILQGRYVATSLAVLTGGIIAMLPGQLGPGSGGLILWPIFGATNQLLAGLAFMVIAFYLLRLNRPVWFLIGPMLVMLCIPAWAMFEQIRTWYQQGAWHLFAFGLLIQILQGWMIVEGVLMWGKVRGIDPAPLQPLPARAAAERVPAC